MTSPPREPPRPDASSSDGAEAALDSTLAQAFACLEPVPAHGARLEDRLVAAFEAESRSLATEWLDLFRVGPARAAVRTLAAGAGLALITQLGMIVLTVLLRG